MKIFAAGAGLLVTCGILAGGINRQVPHAEEKKEVFVPPAEVKKLLEKPLPGVEGKQVTIYHATLRPGLVGGKHYHTGPVYVYVLEGAFTIDEPGKPRQTFQPGELYEEPIGTPMQARNLSTSETKILVFQVGGHGEPLMYKAD
ncbi:MAG: cupin domain-containing protein [Candidatus Rokuibacteriota bacterium]